MIASVDAHERTLFSSGQADVGDLLMRLGRPILTAPGGRERFRVPSGAGCFKEVREARRALADALPVLQAMKRVDVVEIVESGTIEAPGDGSPTSSAWLARHGVAATCEAIRRKAPLRSNSPRSLAISMPT